MKRKILSVLLAMAILIGFIPQPASARDARLWVEGRYITGDVSPYIHKNRTLVPLRQVAEALGLDIQWNAQERQVHIKINDEDFIFSPGESHYRAGDKMVEMDTETVIRDNRTFLPLRVIAEAMGKPVSWDQATYTAVVGTGYSPETPSSNEKTDEKNEQNIPVTPIVQNNKNNRAIGAPQGKGHIRGNRNSRIYHLPQDASYHKIAPRNIVLFESEAQAQAAGYRRAKR